MNSGEVGRCLTIDAPLVAKNVVQIRQSILEALDGGDALSLAISNSAAVDACGLQLIESARRQALLDGKTLTLKPGCAEFQALVESAGFLSAASEDALQFWRQEGPRP